MIKLVYLCSHNCQLNYQNTCMHCNAYIEVKSLKLAQFHHYVCFINFQNPTQLPCISHVSFSYFTAYTLAASTGGSVVIIILLLVYHKLKLIKIKGIRFNNTSVQLASSSEDSRRSLFRSLSDSVLNSTTSGNSQRQGMQSLEISAIDVSTNTSETHGYPLRSKHSETHKYPLRSQHKK